MTLQVAVVGLGIGEQHARAWAAQPGFGVRWVLDLDPERMERTIAALGQGAAAESFETVLADPETHVVSIATYDNEHAAQTIAALRAGKHVFCEKPLCHTAAELDELVAAWRASGKALASNLVLRAAPVYRWLGRAIAEGRLGKVYSFDAEYLYGRLHKITDGWRARQEDYSVTLGGGIHMVDLLLGLTGERPSRVTAVGSRQATEGTAFRYDDFCAATLQFPSGMVGRIVSNFACVHRHQHVVRVYGTKGTFLSDDEGPRFHDSRYSAVPSQQLPEPILPASKGDLIPDFAKAVAGGLDRSVETLQEFAVVSVCLAIDWALATAESEDIRYP